VGVDVRRRSVPNPDPNSSLTLALTPIPTLTEILRYTGYTGDQDPIDIIDISETPCQFGTTYRIKVLGAAAMIDNDETDWKIVSINVDDPLATLYNDITTEEWGPKVMGEVVWWFSNYKAFDCKVDPRPSLPLCPLVSKLTSVSSPPHLPPSTQNALFFNTPDETLAENGVSCLHMYYPYLNLTEEGTPNACRCQSDDDITFAVVNELLDDEDPARYFLSSVQSAAVIAKTHGYWEKLVSGGYEHEETPHNLWY
jgi:hypothetical protein